MAFGGEGFSAGWWAAPPLSLWHLVAEGFLGVCGCCCWPGSHLLGFPYPPLCCLWSRALWHCLCARKHVLSHRSPWTACTLAAGTGPFLGGLVGLREMVKLLEPPGMSGEPPPVFGAGVGAWTSGALWGLAPFPALAVAATLLVTAQRLSAMVGLCAFPALSWKFTRARR